MRKHIPLIALLCAPAIACAMPAPAEADTTAHTLQEVTVRSAKASKAATSAAPLRTADSQLMLKSGVADVADAVSRMPGVNLRDYGGAGGLKTVSVRGFGAGHTAIIYDGVPLSDAQNGQIDLSRYSIDNVGSVSLVIGDNDDIFQPARLAASAATVSISTFKPADRLTLNAKLRTGSFGYVNPCLQAAVPLNTDAALTFAGDFTHADNDYPFTLVNGTVTTREHRTNSRINSGHAELGLYADMGALGSLSAKAYGFSSSRCLPGPVIYYNSISHERLAEQNAMAQAQWRFWPTSRLSINAIAKANFASSLYHDENGKYPGGILDQNYWQREYYVSGALLWSASDALLLNYSADYFHNSLNSNLPTDRRPYRNSILQTATAKLKLSRLSIMGRILASVYVNGAHQGPAARNATRLSPSLSLSVQPWENRLLFLRASYKSIFRVPTFNEAYFDHYGSADIRPENTDQLNLGITYTAPASPLLPTAVFTLDAYANRITDMIVAVPYNMFIWSMTNLSKAVTLGVDATAFATVSPGRGHDLTLQLSYSFQRAMPRTSRQQSDWMKQVAYIPKHSASVSLCYENPWVNASVWGTGVSERYTTNANLPATRIPGYAEFGASLWRNFNLGRYSLGIKADAINIFDKQYCIIARYPMPGRQFKITLEFNY